MSDPKLENSAHILSSNEDTSTRNNPSGRTAPKSYAPKSERPSNRIFRRSRRAEMRRRQAAKDDANFFRAVFSIAGVATAFVFILIYLASSGGGGGLIGLASLSHPSIGPFSILEIGGFGFIAVLAIIYWMRIRKR